MKFILLLWIILPEGLSPPIELAAFSTLADCEASISTVKASGPEIMFIAGCRDDWPDKGD